MRAIAFLFLWCFKTIKTPLNSVEKYVFVPILILFFFLKIRLKLPLKIVFK